MILNGKAIADTILDEVARKVQTFSRSPGLAFVLVGEHAPSFTYVNMKAKACLRTGIRSRIVRLPTLITEKELLGEIEKLNLHPHIDGILVQMPLPPQIDARKVIFSIDPEKDVDGFHPVNKGKLFYSDPSGFVTCTPLGITLLVEKSGLSWESKHVVIVGRSTIVGKPLANLLMQKRYNATVTVCHTATENLSRHTKAADIVVACSGIPHLIQRGMVSPRSVVVDVGISRREGKLCGDADFESLVNHVAAISPVPGGVGPMTIACLMQNTIKKQGM